MSHSLRPLLLAAALLGASTAPALAQQPAPLVTDLISDVSQVQQKLLALARAMPADKYDWRPGTGVRSVGEVFKHVATDNYLLPAAMGVPADPSTGITAGDFKAAAAYEKRPMTRDQVISELEKSFTHLKTAMNATGSDRLAEKISMFGHDYTVQQAWILTATHLHEHLGQSIAYARSNGVVPPWSK